MIERRPYDIEMRPDGTFVETARDSRYPGWTPPRGGGVPRALVIGAVLLGSVIVAGLALSLALVLIPLALGAALIGYGALRFQLWRMRRSGVPSGHWAGQFGPIMAQMSSIIRARRDRR